MSEFVGGIVLLVSLALIGHSGLSAVERKYYLSFAKSVHSQADTSLPIDITLECLLGLLLSIFGAVLYAGEFQEVKMDKEISKRTMDILGMTPSFKSVRHRGSRLSKQTL
ncbi:transmembrane protein 32-like protein [Obelidium mucronatum]|nr:transmembrane protein 32-like protein [Obelidium mucronatum]